MPVPSNESAFSITVAFMATVATYACFLLLWFGRFFCCRGGRDNLSIIYNNCSYLNYTNQYVLRLLFTGMSSSFRINETTIHAHIIHSFDRIMKVQFTPRDMEQMFIYKTVHCAKIYLRTSEKLRDVRSVWLFHDGTGSLVVQSLELQDIGETNAVIAEINYPIGDELTMKKVSPFPFDKEKPCELENDIRPSKNVSWVETSYIIFTCIMVIYTIVGQAIVNYCRHPENKCKWNMVFIMAAATFGIAVVSFLIMALPFRFCIKERYHNKMGLGNIHYIRFFYLVAVLVVGHIGFIFMVMTSTSYKFASIPDEQFTFDVDIFWSFTCGMAVLLFFLGLIISLPIAFCTKYIYISNDQNWKDEIQKQFKARDRRQKKRKVAAYRSDEGMPSSSTSMQSSEEETAQRARKQKDKKKKKKRKAKTDSPDDEETYVETLARGKEIRSISQFMNKRRKR